MSGATADTADRVAGLPLLRAGGAVRSWGRLAIWLLLGAATLVPLLFATVPPLVDYPNHLARMWILVHGASVPALAANYVVNWRILPDLAMDLVIPALAHLMPVVEAGRVFIGLTMVGLVAGTITLHRVLHGRSSLWPICCVLFVYNAVLFWGFLGCLFASALYLFAFSGWIASRNWRLLPRILLFSAVAALLLLLHAFAFGLYGLSVASYEFARRTEGRRVPVKSLVSFSLLCLQFVPGLTLWYLSLENVRSAHTAYGGWTSKIYALLAPLTFGWEPVLLDKAIWLAVAIAVMFALIRGALKIVPEMRFPLAAMIAVAVLMPNTANGSWLADIRLPVMLPFIVIASSRVEIGRRDLKFVVPVAGLLLFALRIWTESQSWYAYDRWFAEFRQASSAVAPGSRLLIVETLIEQPVALPGVPTALAHLQPQVFWHMGALAVIDRSAFFPYLFTQAATINAAPRNQEVAQSASVPISPEALASATDPAKVTRLETETDVYGQRAHWRHWPRTFDYVLWMDFSGKPRPQLPQLTPLRRGSFFEIDQVKR
jgi:hypothetical protein